MTFIIKVAKYFEDSCISKICKCIFITSKYIYIKYNYCEYSNQKLSVKKPLTNQILSIGIMSIHQLEQCTKITTHVKY